jgi:hypothetical protein
MRGRNGEGEKRRKREVRGERRVGELECIRVSRRQRVRGRMGEWESERGPREN